MKKFLTGILILFVMFNLSAQHAMTVTADDPVVKKFTQAYDLNDAQVQKMITIQERRIRNLSEIESLKASDAKTYYQKRVAINKGTHTSLGMMMTPEQYTSFKSALLALREQKAIKATELKEGGLTYDEIQIELLEIDDSMF